VQNETEFEVEVLIFGQSEGVVQAGGSQVFSVPTIKKPQVSFRFPRGTITTAARRQVHSATFCVSRDHDTP
jgi:hypothetical protein